MMNNRFIQNPTKECIKEIGDSFCLQDAVIVLDIIDVEQIMAGSENAVILYGHRRKRTLHEVETFHWVDDDTCVWLAKWKQEMCAIVIRFHLNNAEQRFVLSPKTLLMMHKSSYLSKNATIFIGDRQ